MFVYCHLELVAADVPELAREFHRRFASDHSLAHGEEVVALAGLASPAHLRSDPTAAKLRQNRMPVRCCQYTFDLLVKYLHVANQMALLSILNARVAVTVTRACEAGQSAQSTILVNNTQDTSYNLQDATISTSNMLICILVDRLYMYMSG